MGSTRKSDNFMKGEHVELSVTQIGKFKVIKPSGRIDWESARLLDKEVQQIISRSVPHCV